MAACGQAEQSGKQRFQCAIQRHDVGKDFVAKRYTGLQMEG